MQNFQKLSAKFAHAHLVEKNHMHSTSFTSDLDTSWTAN
jgi:hypothetical protein